MKTRVQLKQSENFGRSKFVSTTIFSRDFDDFSWSASVSGFITVFLSMICCWFKYGKDHFDENCLHKEKFSIRSSCYRRLKTHQLNMRSHRTAQTFSYLIYRVLVVVVVAHSGDVWNSKKKSLLLVWWIFPPNLHYKLQIHISIIAILKFCCTIFPVLEVVCDLISTRWEWERSAVRSEDVFWCWCSIYREHSTVTSQLQWHEVIIRSDGISCWQKIIIMTKNWFLVWHFCI